jgi:outer membrane protein TolC
VVQTVSGTEATTNSFKFKILDKLDIYSDRQLADIDYDRSRQELNKIKNDVTLETQEGCFNYEKALIQLETATNKVKYQEADLELMKMKRGMDEVQDSNVVDSLIKVAQEKFGYVQAVTDCKNSLAALEKAVGIQDYFKNK